MSDRFSMEACNSCTAIFRIQKWPYSSHDGVQITKKTPEELGEGGSAGTSMSGALWAV